MIYKTITLKFADGRLESAFIMGRTEKSCQRQIGEMMVRTGAYGFSTQSSVSPRGSR